MIVIQSVIDNKRIGKEASEILNLSERQVWRLVKKVKNNGIDNLKHGNCNKTPKNKITDDVVEKIVQLKKWLLCTYPATRSSERVLMPIP